jgi:hypothetical protein
MTGKASVVLERKSVREKPNTEIAQLRIPASVFNMNRQSNPTTTGARASGTRMNERKMPTPGTSRLSTRARPNPSTSSSPTAMTTNSTVTTSEFQKSGLDRMSWKLRNPANPVRSGFIRL